MPWRNLSVVMLAGAALVGCNSAPQKDTTLGTKPKDQPWGTQQTIQQPPSPAFPNPNTPQPFPQTKADPFGGPARPGAPPTNPFAPTNPPAPTGFGNSSQNPPPGPSFPIMTNPNNSLGGSPSPGAFPATPSNSFGPPPTIPGSSSFGTTRTTVAPVSFPASSPPLDVQPPAGFPPRN
jgi:hypothetical protein